MKEKEIKKQNPLIEDTHPDVLYQDACTIIDQAQVAAYRAVNETLIKRNWLLGMRIQHEVLKDKRAEYGEQVVANLANALVKRYGRGFSMRNLYNFIAFYQSHPNIFHAEIGKSGIILQSLTAKSQTDDQSNILQSLTAKSENIVNALCAQSPFKLTWTHYSIILQENSKEARDWYEQEAAREMWSTRTLQRNVSSQYYHRLLRSQNKEAVHNEMQKLTAPLQDKLEYLKNPVVAHYSVLNSSDQLYAAKYLTYMPTQEELRREIEQQKGFFRLQNAKI